jgi:hypothetical protein
MGDPAHVRAIEAAAAAVERQAARGGSPQSIAQAAISAYLATMRQADWKLVPIEPSEEMISAVYLARSPFRTELKSHWQAMLKRAPNPEL